MTARTVKRHALNRGTAVWLGGNRVRFVWPCGCRKVESLKDPGKRPLNDVAVRQLVRNWRANGVVLEQCPTHPKYYMRESQLARLNAQNSSA